MYKKGFQTYSLTHLISSVTFDLRHPYGMERMGAEQIAAE